ncbi:glycosyltransferase [Nocardioides ferulae]|uniref:glycosyltransferase n=1 Tax=Nocardioides ferulae TaxID=2340821 RepID=UPI000EB28642|nr:glycosyltransferase [Nocardioides ferulae]
MSLEPPQPAPPEAPPAALEIVIPAHNEEHRIGRTLAAYSAELVAPDLVLTVALDDCTDRTAAVVAEHARQDPRIRIVEYPRLGKGGVLAEAFRASTADVIAFVDADCATPPSEIQLLTETLTTTGADIAIASRWHPSSVLPKPRSLSRRLASAGFSRAVKTVFALPFHDTQCGAKVITREAASRVIPLLSSRDFLFDVDLLVTARALDLRVAEMPTVWIDRDGSRVEATRDSLRMAASLARLWLHHRVVPVRMPARALPATGRVAAPARDRVHAREGSAHAH